MCVKVDIDSGWWVKECISIGSSLVDKPICKTLVESCYRFIKLFIWWKRKMSQGWK
jgi:hypothetical protein